MRYQFIIEHRSQFPLRLMCRVLEVSVSGYHAWSKRQAQPLEDLQQRSQRAQENRRLLLHIRAVYRQSGGNYGSPRIHAELRAQGQRCSQKRVARLMAQAGISAQAKRRFVATTDSAHTLPVATNLLERHFDVARLNTVWAGDITYVWTQEGWLYLAVLLDLCSRRVLGWALDTSLEVGLARRTLERALVQRDALEGLDCKGVLHHSDRGSQYASHQYQQLLEWTGITCSMSRRGNCYDNAPVESFFATLKRELIYKRHFVTRAQAQAEIEAWIESYYNAWRRHSALGYLSPLQFELRIQQQQAVQQRGAQQAVSMARAA